MGIEKALFFRTFSKTRQNFIECGPLQLFADLALGRKHILDNEGAHAPLKILDFLGQLEIDHRASPPSDKREPARHERSEG
jgi:hypothetical protein